MYTIQVCCRLKELCRVYAQTKVMRQCRLKGENNNERVKTDQMGETIETR
jgi:hypothetical protein